MRQTGAGFASSGTTVTRHHLGALCHEAPGSGGVVGWIGMGVGLVWAPGPWRPDRDSVNEVGSPLFRVPGGESTRRGTCGGVGISFLRPWPL